MNFTFFSPVKIIFGPGTTQKLPSVISDILKKPHAEARRDSSTNDCPSPCRALVVLGSSSRKEDNILNALKSCQIPYEVIHQSGEPTVEGLVPEVERARDANVDIVIAQGGGSVIDAGKAVAALVPNKDDIMHYLEVIGDGAPLTEKPLPMIAIPTTAGTGSEATSNAVLASMTHQVKVSLRSDFMYPDVAIVDPLLTTSMPREITAATGMDALTQLIESFTSRFATPFTDALCRDGIMRVASSLEKALEMPDDVPARSDMSLAGLYSGITLVNAKLGAVHGIAGPMGGMIHAPHGAVCARMLGPVMRENVQSLDALLSENAPGAESGPDMPSVSSMKKSLEKYAEVAHILAQNPEAPWSAGIEWVEKTVSQLKIPTLKEMGLTKEQVPILAQKAQNTSSMKGNPVTLSVQQLTTLLTA